MSKRKLDIIILVLLMILGAYYIYQARHNGDVAVAGEVSSALFPTILGISLIAFCLISILKWLKKTDEVVDFPGMKNIIITISIIVVYFLLWEFVGYFYILTFFFTFILITIYRYPIMGVKIRGMGINFVISLGVIVFIFVLFNKLMYVDF